MLLPTDWTQYHLYGTKIPKANNRGKGGICALVNPKCPHTVIQLPSLNNYTLSMKIGALRIHCLYLPPSLHHDQVFDILDSIPLYPDTILCGDFNARLGAFLGDHDSNPRGNRFRPWLETRQLSVLNQSLAPGIATFHGSRNAKEISSIIDLFITNIEPSNILDPNLTIASDLSLGSDHRLMTLSFNLEPSSADVTVLPSNVLNQRRVWNLSKLNKPDNYQKYRSTFQTTVSPLQDKLAGWASSPPLLCPSLDTIADSLNECVYKSLDASIGTKSSRPSYWKKYWTLELQHTAQIRDNCFRKWRQAIGIDKIYWFGQHKLAMKVFRTLVQKEKRASWKKFCSTLESNFSKATKTISRIKKRNSSSATFSHPDGPTKALDLMSGHLASVYDGSFLSEVDRTAEVILHDFMPYDLPSSALLDTDNIMHFIKQLPNGKSPGPDHVKAEMLKPLVDVIAPVLANLFKICWQWSNTPSLWRQATVFPIHKKGDQDNPANYRPISLTSILRKLFEMVLSSTVVESSPIIDVSQGGFRTERSPLDQALSLHDLMHDYFVQHHHYPTVAFLDIKQAYDTVDRRVVWKALLDQPSCSRPLLALLMNLFDEVSVSVLLANQSSVPFSPSTGLLQGSVLSPHLYSVYINSLPAVLREAASAKTTIVTVPGESRPTAINSLLFADDVAIFGNKFEVQDMLNLAAKHSFKLGFRWNPAKCAILNAPSSTSSSSINFQFKLYDQVIPTVTEFTYLGMEFVKNGLHAEGILAKRSAGAIKTMALLNSIGVNRNGFSLLFCKRIYTCFIRPKFEYGLAISYFRAPELKKFEKLQDSLIQMFLGSNHTTVAKHITCIPAMVHRYNSLVTRYVLRSKYLPEDSLVLLLRDSLQKSRLRDYLQNNVIYQSLPDPLPSTDAQLRTHFQQHWQDFFDQQCATFARNGKHVLLRACRSNTFAPDPILYLPMNNIARSRLVRWRLGRFTAMARQECLCADGSLISRNHFQTCRAIDPSLFEDLPATPFDVNIIDHALSKLPTKASSRPPAFWPALLNILWYIDTLCHPTKIIPEDPDPGSSWFHYVD